jgi:hypothetical protein
MADAIDRAITTWFDTRYPKTNYQTEFAEKVDEGLTTLLKYYAVEILGLYDSHREVDSSIWDTRDQLVKVQEEIESAPESVKAIDGSALDEYLTYIGQTLHVFDLILEHAGENISPTA